MSAVTKSVWKVVERTPVLMAPFRHRPPSEWSGRLWAYPTFGREYGRLPPGWVTFVAMRDSPIRYRRRTQRIRIQMSLVTLLPG
jgi:hypothetical protein